MRVPTETNQTYRIATARVKRDKRQKVTQHCSFQVKAMFLEIAEHFFDPHSAAITAQSHLPVRQIGGQAPGLFLADLPVNQQVGRVNLFDRQIASSQPDTLTRLLRCNSRKVANRCFHRTRHQYRLSGAKHRTNATDRAVARPLPSQIRSLRPEKRLPHLGIRLVNVGQQGQLLEALLCPRRV